MVFFSRDLDLESLDDVPEEFPDDELESQGYCAPAPSLKGRVAETYTRTLVLQVEATHSRAKVAWRAIGVLDSHRPSVVAEFGEALYHNLSRLDVSYPSR